MSPEYRVFLRTERKLTVLGAGGCLAIVIIGSFMRLLVGAYPAIYLSKQTASGGTATLCSVFSIFAVIIYTQVPITDATMLASPEWGVIH